MHDVVLGDVFSKRSSLYQLRVVKELKLLTLLFLSLHPESDKLTAFLQAY